MLRFRRFALLLLTLLGATACTVDNSENELLIANVRIVSGQSSQIGEATDVLIRRGRIVEIGALATRGASRGAAFLDGGGHYLIPGLIDGHTHLNEVPGMTADHEQDYPDVAVAARKQIPKSFLFHGFTTVIDLNSEPTTIKDWNTLPVRPQAYFCGAAPVFDGYPMSFMPKPARYEIMPYFLFDASRAADFPVGFDPTLHSPSAVASRILDDGGICLKTHYEKGFGGRGNLPVPTVELAIELVAAAHELGLPVLMHANSEESQAFGVETGVDAFAHGMWTWNDGTATDLHSAIATLIDDAIERGIALQPTIQVLYGEQDIHNPDYLSDPRLLNVLPESLIDWYDTADGQWWRDRMLNVPIVAQLVAEGAWAELDAPPIARVSATLGYFAKRDGKLLFGSDTPSDPTFANPPGLNGRLEMDRWIAAGVTPATVFRALTISNAEFFGLADRIGTVEVGKNADLLILTNNPLENVAAYDRIQYVILGGKVIERSSLSAMGDLP